MKIRIMTLEDYEEVCRLWQNTPGMGLNNVDDSREGLERFLRRNPTSCFVAEEEEKITGTILCGHDGRRGYLYHAAVAEAYQGQGIGKALLEAALHALEQEGIAKVALVALKRNSEGNGLWEKQGFFVREDLHYRNKLIREMEEIHT